MSDKKELSIEEEKKIEKLAYKAIHEFLPSFNPFTDFGANPELILYVTGFKRAYIDQESKLASQSKLLEEQQKEIFKLVELIKFNQEALRQLTQKEWWQTHDLTELMKSNHDCLEAYETLKGKETLSKEEKEPT
jgi:hypothetical protein